MHKSIFCVAMIFCWLIISCGGNGSEDKSASADKQEAAPPPPPVDDHAAGEKIFRTYCITCHGVDGKLALNGAKDLSASELDLDEKILQVTKGKGLMTPFEGILTEEQIRQVSQYTVSLIEK